MAIFAKITVNEGINKRHPFDKGDEFSISQLPKLCVKISIFEAQTLTLILTLISRADWSDKLEWYIVERYIVFFNINFHVVAQLSK